MNQGLTGVIFLKNELVQEVIEKRLIKGVCALAFDFFKLQLW
jgi:hypothetical protein